jgi:hypothetical protein
MYHHDVDKAVNNHDSISSSSVFIGRLLSAAQARFQSYDTVVKLTEERLLFNSICCCFVLSVTPQMFVLDYHRS